MNFYQPRKRKERVPIVPLIDILTILLIFFIVTRGVPKEEQLNNPPPEPRPVVKVTLPVVKEMETTEVVERRAVLAVTAEGAITLDNYELASPDLLADALIVFRKENPHRKLELAADRGATLAQLFLVLDGLTAAQYDIKDVPARIRLPQPVDFVDPLQP